MMKKILSYLFALWKPQLKYILFESVPDFSGSPFAIYEELKKRGYAKRYVMLWVSDYNSENTIDFYSSKKSIIKKIWIIAHSKIVIDSNRGISKLNPNTFRLFTRHGGTLKKCDDYLCKIGKADAILSLSKEIADIDYDIFAPAIVTRRSQILELGMPANDFIFKANEISDKLFWEKHFNSTHKMFFSKVIGWMPTFRQHKSGNDDVSTKIKFPFGIPLIYDEKQLTVLNAFLSERNILLAIQIHHAQKKFFPNIHFSNIILISSKIKMECNVSNAELMNCFDAMITDYSAAYYEFVLLNRPIAISIDDYEEYSKKIGFSVDFFDFIRGKYLKTFEDLLLFIREISQNEDSCAIERKIAMKKIHKWRDDGSTKRVVDFIEQNTILQRK